MLKFWICTNDYSIIWTISCLEIIFISTVSLINSEIIKNEIELYKQESPL